MSHYRTPDGVEESDIRIQEVLHEATESLASLLHLIAQEATSDLIDLWVDRVYNHIRDELDPEQRIRAIILLLRHDAAHRAFGLTKNLPKAHARKWARGLPGLKQQIATIRREHPMNTTTVDNTTRATTADRKAIDRGTRHPDIDAEERHWLDIEAIFEAGRDD